MIIKLIPPGPHDTAAAELPEPDMVVDPRHIYGDSRFKFEAVVIGTTLTLTRIERSGDEDPGWEYTMKFRIYSRNEFHYSFESTKYLYHGIRGERAPEDATEIIFKDGIKTIMEDAFHVCSSLSKITIPDTVTSIKHGVFAHCNALRYIYLPSNLRYIENLAFWDCESLEAIYIPPTITDIGISAFEGCTSLRIINIPDSGVRIREHTLVQHDDGSWTHMNYTSNPKYSQWLRNRYTPFHNLCWNPSVTVNNIKQCMQQHILTDRMEEICNERKDVKLFRKLRNLFHKLCCKPSEANIVQERNKNEVRARSNDKPQFTPLHLLAVNPSVTSEMIMAYLQIAPDVAVMQDTLGKTPLHMLCSVPYLSNASGGAIRAYLGFEEGRKVAFMTDNEGRTPLDLLCEKGFDEMPFLKNKCFGGMMVWWYDCLGINFFAQGID